MPYYYLSAQGLSGTPFSEVADSREQALMKLGEKIGLALSFTPNRPDDIAEFIFGERESSKAAFINTGIPVYSVRSKFER